MGNYFDTANEFVRHFQATKLLADNATGEILRRYADVVKVYPRNGSDLIASHNDLKPQNMRFDRRRIWLVDREAAFLNDRYVDLTVAATFFVKDETQKESYLNACFSEPAGEYRRSRFYLARQAVSMFYATLLLLDASSSGLSIEEDMVTPDFRNYHQELISGKVDMMNVEEKLQYGMIHRRVAARNMRTPRFEEAVARVDAFHASEQADLTAAHISNLGAN